ncbi:unnamed protein product [Danaus chrysippus]|uniref:(African queen) hypothetical protein n=1 Tax=Danaus chrysippus TaxID=151541 RepID=A0A8J2QJY2_9NEOP|nr:unnamed protein product [Danaus chrysippus]
MLIIVGVNRRVGECRRVLTRFIGVCVVVACSVQRAACRVQRAACSVQQAEGRGPVGRRLCAAAVRARQSVRVDTPREAHR